MLRVANTIAYSILTTLFLGVFFVLALQTLTASAQTNPQINYQGKLTASTSVAVPNGEYNFTFRLYDAPTGGSLLWTEFATSSVQNGLFSYMLGASSTLTGVDFNQTLYLGVEVEGDGEMLPRKILGSVPSAFEARNAETFAGLATTSFLRSNQSDTLEATSANTLLTITQNGAGDILNLFSGVTQLLTVNSDGVGIGTTTPNRELVIDGDFQLTGGLYDNANSGGTSGQILQSTNGGITWVSTSTLNYLSNVNDAVTPDNLLAGSQVDEYCLTYEATGDTWDWQDCSAGAFNLGDLGDVNTTGATDGNLLSYNGTTWVDIATSTLNIALTDTFGILAPTRGGTGLSTVNENEILIGGAGNTWTQVATSSLNINTDDLTEGATNFFWTDGRFDARLAATTSLPNLTTLVNLATIGTITTGVWQGTAIDGQYIATSTLGLSTDDVTEGTNLYYLDSRVAAYILGSSTISRLGQDIDLATEVTGTLDIASTSLGVTATGLELSGDNLALTAGYEIPLSASTTNWNTFYNTPSSRITAGDALTWTSNTLDLDINGLATDGDWGTGDFLVYYDDGGNTYKVAYDSLPGAGGGLTSLNSQTQASQSFATTSDTNITLAITSAGGVHTFAPGWTGTLAATRGGTGLSSITNNQLLIGGPGNTVTQVATATLNINTDDLVEGTNLFYTDARVASYVISSSTISRLGQLIEADELDAGTATGGYVLQASTTASGGFVWVATSTLGIDGTGDDLSDNSIQDLSDVAAMTEDFGDLFYWNGSAWADIATSGLNIAIGDTVGILDPTRGGTGLSSITENNLLIGGAGNTFTQIATSSLGFRESLFTDGGATTYLTALGDNVGIGTTSANAKLTVAGDINIDDPSSGISWMGTRYLYASSTNDSIAFGENAGATFNSGTTYNVALGFEAGRYASTTLADQNNYIGYRAGENNSGSSNNIFGVLAGNSNTGNYNNIIGTEAGTVNTGDNNSYIGYQAGRDVSAVGNSNVYLGDSAGKFAGAGSFNSYIGYQSGFNSVGSNNLILGSGAGTNNTGSNNITLGSSAGQYSNNDDNIYIGQNAGIFNYGQENVYIGRDAGYNTFSTSSVGVGAYSLRGLGYGDEMQNNTALGFRTGYSIDTGADNNILIGYQAADSLTTGANNIVIGYDVEAPSNTGDNQLNIGNLLFGTGIDGTGTTLSSGNIGIGTTSPSSKLTVAGGVYFGGNLRATGTVQFDALASTPTTSILVIDQNGNVTASSSDFITPDMVLSGGQVDGYCLTYQTTSDTWDWVDCSGGAINLGDLGDVNTTGAIDGNLLSYNGTTWVDIATSTLNLNTDDLTEGATNLFYTDARSRGAISETITGIGYDSGTGVFSLDAGYIIPLLASTTNWNAFYDTPSSRITAGTGLSWADNVLNVGNLGSSTLDDAGTYTAGYVLQASSTASGGFVWVATSTLGISGGGGSSFFTENGSTTYLTNLNDTLAVGTTTSVGSFAIDRTLTGTGNAGINQYYSLTNNILSGVVYGGATYIDAAPTATSTIVGDIIRLADNTTLGNNVQGFQVQTNRGSNILGENTAIAGFGRTFGVKGTTEGDAGELFEPAGVFAETRGSTQGNALRAFSDSITTADLVVLGQDTSAFSGTGLLMDFGQGGSFTGDFLLLQNNSSEVLRIASNGAIFSSSTATSTFDMGINLTAGCFAVSGVCISGGGGSSLFTDGGATTYLTSLTDALSIGTTSSSSARFAVEAPEDTALIALGDSTNNTQANVYTGTTTPNGRVTAPRGSLYIDTSSAQMYQNTDAGTSWSPFTNGTTTHMAKMTRDAAQSISASPTYTKIAFDNIDFDTGGIADATTNDRFDIKKDGKYLVTANMNLPGLDGNERLTVLIYVNGVSMFGSTDYSPTTDFVGSVSLAETLDLSAGDYVEMYVQTNDTSSNNTSTDIEKPRMSVVELAPSGGTGIDLFTDAGADSYLTSTSDNLLIGTTTNAADGKFIIQQQNASDIVNIYDGSTEVFSIVDGGNVGIGDTTPAYLFTVGDGDVFGVNSSGLIATQSVASSSLLADSWTDGYVLQASSTATGGFAWVATSTLGISGGGGSSLFTENGSTTYLANLNDTFAVGTTTASGSIAIDRTLTSAGIAGLNQYYGLNNSVLNDVLYGGATYIDVGATATSTIVGNIIRINDDTTLGNNVQGFQVQTNRGGNTFGENTAIAGFGRTFGVKGVTEGDAGELFEPAGVFAETRGTTQGNALRAFSDDITSANLVEFVQDTSAFTGDGLVMNFGIGGSFSGDFLNLQNGGSEVLRIDSAGTIWSSSTATSTFAGGINIEGGCVAVNGTCISGGGGSSLFTDGGATTYLTALTDNLAIGTTTALTDFVVDGGAMFGAGFFPSSFNASNTLTILAGANADGATNGITFAEEANGFGMKLGYDGVGLGDENALRIYDGNDSALFTFQNGGALGIGTSNFSELSSTISDIAVYDTDNSGQARIDLRSGSTEALFSARSDGPNDRVQIGSTSAHPLFIYTNSQLRSVIDTSGGMRLGNNLAAGSADFSLDLEGDNRIIGFQAASLNPGTRSGLAFTENDSATPSMSLLYDGSGSGANNLITITNDDASSDLFNFMKGGSFGIGTTSQNRLLEIASTSNPGIRITDSTNDVVLDMRAEDFQGFIGTFSNDDLRFVTNNQSRMTLDTSGNLGIGTTSPQAKLSLDVSTLDGAGVAALDQYITTENTSNGAVQFGNRYYLNASNTATTTIVGSMFRIKDDTEFANTVRGLEVQASRGLNTLGENTALSGFARTFGVRGVTTGDAGASFEPAGGFFETEGTTQGNAIRGFSDSITTASLLSLFQSSSTFTGTGLEMSFGNGSGDFSSSSSKYLDFQNGGNSVFTVSAFGTTTIGDGTTNNMASLQIGFGGICVDDDGTCTATSTGWVVADGFAPGNSDLAEMYFSSEDLATGELVQMNGDLSITRASKDNTMPILGIVSTNPGITIGADDTSTRAGEDAYPIALSGRVPVRLSTENGPIKKGDQLMLSSLPGVAMKATSTGMIIGTALEDFDDTKRYSKTYINQFGDSMVEPQYEPLFTNTDPRINDGCYYGGGNATGEEECVPLSATSSFDRIEEANRIAEQDSIAEQLAVLAQKPSERRTVNGETVRVGEVVVFVERTYKWVDDSQMVLLGALMDTSLVTEVGENEDETLMDRLVALANSFVDGVLSIFELRADKVQTNELCVDDVCVTADDLRNLLDSQPASVSDSADNTDTTSAEDNSNDSANEDSSPDDTPDTTTPTTTEDTASSTDPVEEDTGTTTIPVGEPVVEDTTPTTTEEVVEEAVLEEEPEPEVVEEVEELEVIEEPIEEEPEPEVVEEPVESEPEVVEEVPAE